MLVEIQNHVLNIEHIAYATYKETFPGSIDKTIQAEPSRLTITFIGGKELIFTGANADLLWAKLSYQATSAELLVGS
jgi:hypothetical protein